MKKLAIAFGGQTANMVNRADAERFTGYRLGGISPFAQKMRVPTAIDETAFHGGTVFLGSGQRGFELELEAHDVRRVLDAIVCFLTE